MKSLLSLAVLVMAEEPGLQCFVGAASRHGILGSICSTLEEFKGVINKRRAELIKDGIPKKVKDTVAYCGSIVIQELLIEKLQNASKDKKYPVDSTVLEKRLEYFKSEQFINNFMSKLPFIDSVKTKGSYTEWFNRLFNVNTGDWREEKLASVDNQSQCKRALGLPPSANAVNLQERGNIDCYICGRKILPARPGGIKTMECEHILPIITALSHWWLVKARERNYSEGELQALAYEYAWAHRCCNQTKSDYEFIYYDKANLRYMSNKENIEYVLDKIKSSTSYDCSDIAGAIPPKQYINISRKIQPIIDTINANIKNCSSMDEYILLTKFKALSALTHEGLLKELLAVEGKLVEIPKSRSQIMKEKKEAMRREAEEEAAAAAAIRESMRMGRAQRAQQKQPDIQEEIAEEEVAVAEEPAAANRNRNGPARNQELAEKRAGELAELGDRYLELKKIEEQARESGDIGKMIRAEGVTRKLLEEVNSKITEGDLSEWLQYQHIRGLKLGYNDLTMFGPFINRKGTIADLERKLNQQISNRKKAEEETKQRIEKQGKHKAKWGVFSAVIPQWGGQVKPIEYYRATNPAITEEEYIDLAFEELRAAKPEKYGEWKDHWLMPESFIEKAGGLDNIPDMILMNPAFSLSTEEFEYKFNDLFIQRSQIRYGSHGSSITTFKNVVPFKSAARERAYRYGMLSPGMIQEPNNQEMLQRELTPEELQRAKESGQFPAGFLSGGKKKRKTIRGRKVNRKQRKTRRRK